MKTLAIAAKRAHLSEINRKFTPGFGIIHCLAG